MIFDQSYVRYLTNWGFLATERPVALASDAAGELMAFVPEFEVERVRAETDFPRVESYPEYPGLVHPMRLLAPVLADMGLRGAIGADQDGYPGILGYEGPSLSEVTGATVSPLAPLLESMLVRKSPAEVELIRESARWCEYAHRLLQDVLGARRDRGRGRPARRLRSDTRHARGARARSTASSRQPTASRPATAARSASGAPGRTRSGTTSSSRRATSSSARRARRSGATTPSSSGR